MSRPVRLGITGASGFASRCVLPSLHKTTSIRLTAIRSRSKAQARLLAEPFGAAAFDSYEAMLRSEIDAVYIATPVFTHLELATAAARADKAVMLEKPMTRNSGNLRIPWLGPADRSHRAGSSLLGRNVHAPGKSG